MEKKMRKSLFALLALLAVFFVGCSDDDDNGGGGNGGRVVQEVLDLFKKDYPNATNVDWSVTKDEFAIAVFDLSNGTRADLKIPGAHKAWYKNKQGEGKRYMYERDIDFKDLPEAVKNAFKATEYSDTEHWKVDDVEEISRGDLVKLYAIEVESTKNKEDEVELYFDEQGVLVKIEIDLDDDFDKHGNLIVDKELPAEIKTHLEKAHAGYKIVDIDFEDDFLEIENQKIKHWEIEFIEKGVKKEIIFSADPVKWLYTEWEIKDMEQLPEAILATIEKDFPDFEIDDDEFDFILRNEKDTLYKVELESKDGKIEKDVYFTEKGEVIELKKN